MFILKKHKKMKIKDIQIEKSTWPLSSKPPSVNVDHVIGLSALHLDECHI